MTVTIMLSIVIRQTRKSDTRVAEEKHEKYPIIYACP